MKLIVFCHEKSFYKKIFSPSSVNYTGLLTRTSTMESRELELANRENYIIIPSYSEAILLDPLMTTTSPPQLTNELSNGQSQVCIVYFTKFKS